MSRSKNIYCRSVASHTSGFNNAYHHFSERLKFPLYLRPFMNCPSLNFFFLGLFIRRSSNSSLSIWAHQPTKGAYLAIALSGGRFIDAIYKMFSREQKDERSVARDGQ